MNHSSLKKNYSIIDNQEKVKLFEMNHHVEMISVSNCNRRNTTVKLDKSHYMITRTSEVKENNIQASTYNRRYYIRSSLKDAFRKILLNLKEPSDGCFWTLTYAEKQSDMKKLCHDFDYFVHSVRKKCSEMQYIAFYQPQEYGSFHIHMIALNDKNLHSLNTDEVSNIWKHGYTKAKPIYDTLGIANYLTVHPFDIHLDVAEELFPEEVQYFPHCMKTDEKTGREEPFVRDIGILYIPKGKRVYSNSSGIIKPVPIFCTKEEALEHLTAYKNFSFNYATEYHSNPSPAAHPDMINNVIKHEFYTIEAA